MAALTLEKLTVKFGDFVAVNEALPAHTRWKLALSSRPQMGQVKSTHTDLIVRAKRYLYLGDSTSAIRYYSFAGIQAGSGWSWAKFQTPDGIKDLALLKT